MHMDPAAPTSERPSIRRDGESGFTLPELLIAMAMSLVVVTAGLMILQIAIRSEPEGQTRNALIQDAQIASERIARELRQTYTVNSATATSLSVNTYIQSASSCAGAAGTASRQCRVVYTCASGACTRTISELNGANPQTAQVVAGLRSNSIFAYSPTTSAPTRIDFTLSMDAGSAGDAITVTDGVTLRNVSGAIGT